MVLLVILHRLPLDAVFRTVINVHPLPLHSFYLTPRDVSIVQVMQLNFLFKDFYLLGEQILFSYINIYYRLKFSLGNVWND